VNDAAFDSAQERFLALCASSRYAEAEPMVSVVYADGSEPGGAEVFARGGFYEDWGDAVAGIDQPAARTAYAQAEEWYAQFASWAPAGGEVEARMVNVDRLRLKQRDLELRASS
jgi:hypothetical protein